MDIASFGHSGSHISQLMHFLVINSAIRKFSETTQTGRALYAHFSPGPALFHRGATIRSGEILPGLSQ
ncbi:TPA: hypothetical protein ACPFC0_003493 [Klebsiella michiganensis]